MELSEEGHSSDCGSSCIHSGSEDRPDFRGVIDFFHINLDRIAAGSADDGRSLCSAAHVVVVNISFGYGFSSESDWIVRFLLFSNNNSPCPDAF